MSENPVSLADHVPAGVVRKATRADVLFLRQFLGVEPERQDQGTGSALLRPVLQGCDQDGVPAYLEPTCERNVALYERHGFAVVEEVGLPGGGPPLWRMWRDPPAP